MAYQTFQDLIALHKAMDLVVDVYRTTQAFPSDKKFARTAQIRRAAVSIPSNIAEGHGRRGNKKFINFLWIANGSLSEMQTQIILARRLEYITKDDTSQVLGQAEEVGRLISGLRHSLQQN